MAEMEKLSMILWRERELLETLQYDLEVEQLILANGRSRWLAKAASHVESVLDQLRRTEILRAVAADETAAELGLPPNPSLRALAEAVEEPWHTILMDHREAFTQTTRAITELAEANRSLITSGFNAARETLLAMGEAAETYRPDGRAATVLPERHLVDRVL